MKRHPALVHLSRDHHQALLLGQLLKKDTPDYKGMPITISGKVDYLRNAYEKDLIPHFREEEEQLFPYILKHASETKELVEDLKSDHRKVKELVAKLSAQQPSEDDLDELGKLIAKHVRKEERLLFQEVQEVLSDEQLKVLEEIMRREE